MSYNRSAVKYLIIAIGTFTAMFITTPSLAETINVPDPDNRIVTIQDGINAAVDGDTVVVADGVYSGSGNFAISYNGKNIIVKSADGPENCIIDIQHTFRAFGFLNGESSDAVLDGFTIINGNATAGGVAALGTSESIRQGVAYGRRYTPR